MKISENVQKLLPFGYLYLVIMGILKESVFYYQMGINILKYSTIMDILISPIATLTQHPIVVIGVVLFITSLHATVMFLSKKSHNKFVQKLLAPKNSEELSKEEIKSYFENLSIKLIALGLLSFFLGIGLGNGGALSNKIMNDKLKYNDKLLFNSGETEQVYLCKHKQCLLFLPYQRQ